MTYRWQDPPPPAVNYRRNRAYERGQSRIEAQQQAADIAPPAPAAPVFVVDGVEYVEAPEISMFSAHAHQPFGFLWANLRGGASGRKAGGNLF